ncbi:hypothetical protein PUN28_008633 [Cardiocondyla obscurior]|uniref:E3 SUMO-protein ligase NSE2 n=1 Tax=Cardiocondyla obscurior TaxID=286306 RepID=A0AAW2G1V4_9HYME
MTQSSDLTDELDDCFLKTAGNIIKYYDDEESRKKLLKNLRETLEENCIQVTKIKAANEIKEHLQFDNMSELEKDVKNLTQEYRKALSEIKVNPAEDKRLIAHNRQVNDLIQAIKAASNNDLDNTDTDLRLTSSEINVIDPISKTRMTDPVRNAACGHVYDKESLVAMLKKNPNTRCPVVGCTNTDYIVLSQCRFDIVTKTYLENNPA